MRLYCVNQPPLLLLTLCLTIGLVENLWTRLCGSTSLCYTDIITAAESSLHLRYAENTKHSSSAGPRTPSRRADTGVPTDSIPR